MRRVQWLVMGLLLAASAAPAWASSPAAGTTTRENPLVGAPTRQTVSLTDQLAPAPLPAARTRTQVATTTSAVAPFLTRPYLSSHPVTSIFDHCHPDYTVDGRICEFDGTVAVQSNGVDPTFTRGYAITPGGHDYLYYDGHNGWDLGLNYENLLAAADGTVVIAGIDPNNSGFGLNVTIDHGNGFTTRCAHMSQISVTPGQHVLRGQGIGVSGNTGNSTGPHLHFGLYMTSPWTAIDPWGWSGASADPWPADAGNMWIGGNPQDPGLGAPTKVTAALAGQTATVTWVAPASTGGSPVSSYTVTSSPDALAATVPAPATSATFPGLAYSTAYTFTVVAANAAGPGAPSTPSPPVTTGPATFSGMYTLDGYGGVHPVESPALTVSSSWPGWDIARGLSLKADSSGGYVLDGWGGLHPVGNADPTVTGGAYWPGWDIARDIALLPDGSGGYVLDGWGGVHPFASGNHAQPPAPNISASWPGWDIARKMSLFPDGTGGYVLDGWGGIHPFATGAATMPAVVQASASWAGWDIARGITLVPGAASSGYVLDGWGGLHPFGPQGGNLPVGTTGPYWPGWDIARAVVASPKSAPGAPSGWVMDGYGGVHPYGAAGTPRVSAWWGTSVIGRGLASH